MTRPSTSLRVAAVVLACALSGCASLIEDLPDEAPRLADMEEPLELFAEPDDEEARVALPAGGFTGVVVAAAPRTLESIGGNDEGLRVVRVVENSPGDAAGLAEDDLLLEVVLDGGRPRPLRWASDWRQVELDAPAGSTLRVVFDRAGRDEDAALVVARRVRPARRLPTERYREEDRVGAVLRAATEVEARAAGLGPGGGAVVVGLSRASPWRTAGLVFGDLVVSVDGEPVAHPQMLLDAVRGAESDAELDLEFVRDGTLFETTAAVTRRAQEVTDVGIPLLFSYESDRGDTELSLLLALIHYEATPVAWRWRLLWFVSFSGGDSDRLVEEGE